MQPTIRDIKAIINLSETLSFQKTAEYYHISQPTMTKILQNFENAFKVRIFDRNTRRMYITNEGKRIINYFISISDAYDENMNFIQDDVKLLNNKVSIASLPTLAVNLVPEALRVTYASFPDINVKLYDVYSDTCIQYLESKKVDIALSSIDKIDERFEYRKIIEEKFVLIAEKSIIKEINTKNWDESSIDKKPLIVMPKGTGTRSCVEAAFHKSNMKLKPNIELRDLSSISNFVASKYGVSILPLSGAKMLLNDNISYIDIAGIPARKIGIMVRKNCILNNPTSLLSDIFCQSIEMLRQ